MDVTKKNAGIYLRISDDREGRELGVDRQYEDCLKLLEFRGFHLVGVYKDNDAGASTRSRKARPEYVRLLDDAKAKKLDVIVAYTSSRLTRRPLEFEGLIDLAEKVGTEFDYVSSPSFDLRTADGRMIARILASADAAEAERISERAIRKLNANAVNGLPHGRVLYGYQRQADGTRVIREDQAAIVREAAQRVANGETMYVVAQDFNRRGIPTPVSGPWDISKIRGLISKPSYIGKRVHHGNLTDAMWPAILDEKTWQVCVDKLNDPTRKTFRDTRIKHIMSGIATCGAIINDQTCGSVVRPQNNNGIPSYLCAVGGHVSVPRESMDKFVEDQIRERLITVTLVADDDERHQELMSQAKELQVRLAEVESELGNAKGRAVVALTKAMAELEEQIEAITREARSTRSEPIVGILISNPEKWDDLSLPEKRSFIRSGSLIESIEILPVGRRSRVPIGERVVIDWTESRLSTNPNG